MYWIFKHAEHSPFLSLQNAVYFIMLLFLVHVLFTFYIQGMLKKLKKFGCQNVKNVALISPHYLPFRLQNLLLRTAAKISKIIAKLKWKPCTKLSRGNIRQDYHKKFANKWTYKHYQNRKASTRSSQQQIIRIKGHIKFPKIQEKSKNPCRHKSHKNQVS
jgi:hypothetical protein